MYCMFFFPQVISQHYYIHFMYEIFHTMLKRTWFFSCDHILIDNYELNTYDYMRTLCVFDFSKSFMHGLLNREKRSCLLGLNFILKFTQFQTSVWVFIQLSWNISGFQLRNSFLSSFGAAEKENWILLWSMHNIRDIITHQPCTECLENTANCVLINMCSS